MARPGLDPFSRLAPALEAIEGRRLLSGWTLYRIPLPAASEAEPDCQLLILPNGNKYGTTQQGGADGEGSVFEIANGTSVITTLASFNGFNGAGPAAGLTLDSSGDMFGTT